MPLHMSLSLRQLGCCDGQYVLWSMRLQSSGVLVVRVCQQFCHQKICLWCSSPWLVCKTENVVPGSNVSWRWNSGSKKISNAQYLSLHVLPLQQAISECMIGATCWSPLWHLHGMVISVQHQPIGKLEKDSRGQPLLRQEQVALHRVMASILSWLQSACASLWHHRSKRQKTISNKKVDPGADQSDLLLHCPKEVQSISVKVWSIV